MPEDQPSQRGAWSNLGEVANKGIAVLAGVGLLLYFFVGTAYRGYYARFGVTPEDVGITRGTLLDQVGVNAVALLALSVVSTMVMSLAAMLNDKPTTWTPSDPTGPDETWKLPLFLAAGLLIFAAILNYEILGLIGTALAVGAGAVLYLASVKLLDHEIGGARLRDARSASWVVAATLVLGVGYLLAWQIGYRSADRDARERGESDEGAFEQVLPPRLLDARLVPVSVERVDGEPSGLEAPLLLGRAEGTYVFVEDRETIRVPVGSVTVRTGWP